VHTRIVGGVNMTNDVLDKPHELPGFGVYDLRRICVYDQRLSVFHDKHWNF
jgi:hypothetical protein